MSSIMHALTPRIVERQAEVASHVLAVPKAVAQSPQANAPPDHASIDAFAATARSGLSLAPHEAHTPDWTAPERAGAAAPGSRTASPSRVRSRSAGTHLWNGKAVWRACGLSFHHSEGASVHNERHGVKT
jgi:hypothetical protein